MTIDVKAFTGAFLDTVMVLALFATRAFAMFVLWSLIVAPNVPALQGFAVTLPTMMAALALVAVWRGVSPPATGSATALVPQVAMYALIGGAAAWYTGWTL